MNKPMLLLLAMLLPLPAAAQAGDDERDAKIARLERTVELLTRRLEVLEAERTAAAAATPGVPDTPAALAPPVAPPPPLPAYRDLATLPEPSPLPDRPSMDEDAEAAARVDNELPPGQEGLEGYLPLGGTRTWLRLSGYAKLDAMYDTDDAGVADLFVTSAIPAGAQDGRGAFNMHARQTRFTIEARRPTNYGWLRFVLQNDFFGSGGSYGYNLRHAYGQLGNTYAGYGFSAFMDLDSGPDTLDFAGAGAMPFGRLASVRQYFPLRNGNHLFVAAEHNRPEVSGPGAVNARTTTPNLVFGVRHEGGTGHVQAAVLLRHLAYSGDAGSDGATGSGATVSGSLGGADAGFLVYGALAGRGIAAYTGDLAGLGLDATVDGDGSLDVLDQWGGWLGYTYPWNHRWRSTLAYGRLHLERNNLLDPGDFRRSDYAAANLVYSPIPSWSWGVELLYGRLQRQDGIDGDVFRLQTSLKYDFIR
ncbi:DcaP family trimeric outer membrane transporter [Pseudoxanthomonas suwonensis]|uniref:Porin n=1 Tax=Pseudoxanthomonas suwonensis TaxID=314722 RepID=A0A0E3Z115_9GAMM|nr:DcaP family trimeric outer membrane transporter [Pseudoxanthomonas suwonensis]AKC86334.1 hypothetical protein WQ53_05660 [Pseudoxanthomonas suwonensis]